MLFVSLILFITLSRVQSQQQSSSATPWECDCLVPQFCALPWPSNYFRNPTTSRLNMTSNTWPSTTLRRRFNLQLGGWDQLDGFSPLAPMLTFFPDLDVSTLPTFKIIADSLKPDCPTILLNPATGTLLPHWVELDHSSDDAFPSGYDRVLILWPASRLDDSTNYIVGFRNLKNSQGQLITPSPAFASLRDNTPSSDITVNARRVRYEKQIFPSLAAAGINRTSLQLAWDFTTASTRQHTNRLITMRDQALAAIKAGIDFTITNVTDNPSVYLDRVVHGVMTVPNFLNRDDPAPDARLLVSASDPNVVDMRGTTSCTFTIAIPAGLAAQSKQSPVVQYGHGLFADQSELISRESEAYNNGWVMGGTDWWGVSKSDLPLIVEILLGDLSNFASVLDRSHQGLINALMLMKLMIQENFYTNPALLINGFQVIDPSLKYFNGNSQGGIYGITYMAITPDVERGAISVAGAPYSLILPRSGDFAVPFSVLKSKYSTPADRILIFNILNLLWDRIEPSGWIPHINTPLPGTPKDRTLVMAYGLSDSIMTWLGGHNIARSLGASMYKSNVHASDMNLFGFNFIADDQNLTEPGQHLIMGWDFNCPEETPHNVPPINLCDVHSWVWQVRTVEEFADVFLRKGVVYNPCQGPCSVPPPMVDGDEEGRLEKTVVEVVLE